MPDTDRLKDRIVDELERERHTHKSIRTTLAEEYGYTDDDVSRALSALNDEGVIRHEDGYFELTDDR